MANGTQYSHETFSADTALMVDLRFRQISLGSLGSSGGRGGGGGGGGEGGRRLIRTISIEYVPGGHVGGVKQ